MKPCGTYAALRRHERRGETPCDECLEAGRKYRRERRRLNRWQSGENRPRRPPRCGTYSGEQAHRRRGEKPCEACRQAKNEYQFFLRRGQSISRKRRKGDSAIPVLVVDVLETFGHAMTPEQLADHVNRLRPEFRWQSVRTVVSRMAGRGELVEKEPGHWWIA